MGQNPQLLADVEIVSNGTLLVFTTLGGTDDVVLAFEESRMRNETMASDWPDIRDKFWSDFDEHAEVNRFVLTNGDAASACQ